MRVKLLLFYLTWCLSTWYLVIGYVQDEGFILEKAQKDGEVKADVEGRIRRSAEKQNGVGGVNENGEWTGTSLGPLSNKIQYSESGTNSQWEISVKPMSNPTPAHRTIPPLNDTEEAIDNNATSVHNDHTTGSGENSTNETPNNHTARETNSSSVSGGDNVTSAIGLKSDNVTTDNSLTPETGINTRPTLPHSAGSVTPKVEDQNVSTTATVIVTDPNPVSTSVLRPSNDTNQLSATDKPVENVTEAGSDLPTTFPVFPNNSASEKNDTLFETSSSNDTSENSTVIVTSSAINTSPKMETGTTSSPTVTEPTETSEQARQNASSNFTGDERNNTDIAEDFDDEPIPEPEPMGNDHNVTDNTTDENADFNANVSSTMPPFTSNTTDISTASLKSPTTQETWNTSVDPEIVDNGTMTDNATETVSANETDGQSVTPSEATNPLRTITSTTLNATTPLLKSTKIRAVMPTTPVFPRVEDPISSTTTQGAASPAVTSARKATFVTTKTSSQTTLFSSKSTQGFTKPSWEATMSNWITTSPTWEQTNLSWSPTQSSWEPTQRSRDPVQPSAEPDRPVTEPAQTDAPNSTALPTPFATNSNNCSGDSAVTPTDGDVTHFQETLEPKIEPTSEPEVEEESTGKAEPEDGDPEGEPEFDLGAFEEPGPDWDLAKEQWKEAWEFHIYFYGGCFALLGIYSAICVFRLWGMEHLLSRHYFLTLHVLVILVCILRATYLLVDAYNSLGTYPIVVDYFLYNTVFPCISSLFSILFYALLLATRVRILSRKVQKLGVLLAIILCHFALSITTDLIVGIFSTAHVLMFICQSVFILWGLLMFIGYLIVFRKLYKCAINRQKNLTVSSPDRKTNSTSQGKSGTKQRYTYGLAVKITFISAFFGVAIVGFEMYGIFGVFGILQPDVKPQPWPWWTYHLIVRTLELLMCSSVAYVASQPLRYMPRKGTGSMYQYLLPCNACCCSDKLDSSYDSSTISMENVSDNDHISWLKKRNNKANAPYPPHASEKYTDPDATLLVRKIKQNKPSMLVVEDGFVRIRREDEIMPSNQYELDSNSRSSQCSGLNATVSGNDELHAPNSVVNWNYNGDNARLRDRQSMPLSFSLDNYRLPSVGDNRESVVMTEATDDTDIDIVVTDSEQGEHDANDDNINPAPTTPTSNKSGDIFRPLSMIDLAASMESELDRAFHTNSANGVEHQGKVDQSRLSAANDSVYNDNFGKCPESDANFGNYGDSDSDQSKTSSARLIRSPIRRCKSEEKPTYTKSKLFENHRYYSLSSVEIAGKSDDVQDFEYSVQTHRKRTF